VSPLEAHLGYWLRFVSNHVSLAFQQKVEGEGVTVAEWVVLRALYGAGRMKPSEVATTIGLTRGAVSKLLDRLVAKALVVVQADRSDRRAQAVTLTAKGRRLVPTLAALADTNEEESFGHLTAEERGTLRALLKSTVERLGLARVPVD